MRRLQSVGIHLLPLVQYPAVIWRLLATLPRVDILHVQAASFWGFYLPVTLALLLGRLFRRRVVISDSGGLARPFMARRWRLVGPLIRRAQGFAVMSDYVKEIFQREGLEPAVLLNVLVSEHAPFLARSAWPPLLLWSSVLEPEANLLMVLVALARMLKLCRRHGGRQRGRGSLAKEIAAQANALGVAKSVAYRPELVAEQWLATLREASIFWHTASLDNLPERVLEAAASGTVVVGTDVGAMPELLHDGVDALLVQPEDAMALAEATLRVLGRPYLAIKSLASNALPVRRALCLDRGALRSGQAIRHPGGRAPTCDKDELPDDVLACTEFLLSDPLTRPPVEDEVA